MRRILASLTVVSSLLIPATSFALEGIGPRVTVSGTVQEVNITDKQLFSEEGGEYVMAASNGQSVTVILDKYTKIISEGKRSRKDLLPVNITPLQEIRVRGWRVDGNTLTASLIVIMNLELNPTLAISGVVQDVQDDKMTVLTADGLSRTYTVDNGTEINVNYTITGAEGLTLVGKEVLLTLNPVNMTYVRVIRINGNPPAVKSVPTTVDLRMR